MTKVPQKSTAERVLWLLPLGLFASVSVLLFVFLGQYAALVRTQYQIVALKERQHVLERERNDMLLEVQELTSLERVESVAMGRLGMAPPLRRQVLNLDRSDRRESAQL